MRLRGFVLTTTAVTTVAAIVLWSHGAHGQSKVPINPPYRIIADWPQAPAGLKLGAVPSSTAPADY
jgi:hypothetical protein